MFNYEISREKRERGGKCGLKARFFMAPVTRRRVLGSLQNGQSFIRLIWALGAHTHGELSVA